MDVAITVASLAEAPPERWYEVGAAHPTPAALAAEDPRLRLVALRDGEVLARLRVRHAVPHKLTFGAPTYREPLDDPVRVACARSLVERCVAMARGTPGVSLVETRPADDVPHLAPWLSVLSAQGFTEAQCA